MGATRMKLEHHNKKLVSNIGSLLDLYNPHCKFSDVVLRCSDFREKSFYCHKLVLQLNSDHFAKSENFFQFETVEHLTEEQLSEVLPFMYTGEIVLSTANIETILCAADTLHMDDLKNVCFQFMENTLILDDAILCWQLALKYKKSAIFLKCQREVRSEDLMKRLLSSEKLSINSEVEVCEMLLKWIGVQSEIGNEINPEELLPFIRWSGISVDYVHARLLQDTTLMAYPACQNFISKVIGYLISGIQFQGLRTFHRMSTGLNNCMIIVGLGNEKESSNEIFQVSLQKQDSISMLNEIPTEVPILSASCVMGDDIFLTGGGNPSRNETWRFNPITGWFRCTDMLTGRSGHCVATVGSYLYIFGGRTMQENMLTNSIECYEIKKNKWSHAGELIYAIFSATSVTYKNDTYIFGGKDAEGKSLTCVQVFKQHEQTSVSLSITMPRPAAVYRAVLWEKSVILMSHGACYVFNFETQTFLERNKYVAGLNHFGLLLDNETIFLAGGGSCRNLKNGSTIWTLSDEIKTVAVMDVIEDKPVIWKHHSKLPKPSLVHSFGFICLPLNVQL